MNQTKTSTGPLSGFTILDLTGALAGPYATLLLAGLGARVIKVENPDGGDVARHNAPFLSANGFSLARHSASDVSLAVLNRMRGKESVTLNLKQPEAREVMRDLIAKADAVVDNFSRGVLDRLGVGYEFGREVNPRIVYCSITGFGLDYTGGSGKAMDTIIQALSGVMLTSGATGDAPVRVGFPLADMNAPLFAVIGLVAALFQARETGHGQQIDVSMLGALTSMVAVEPYAVLEEFGIPTRTDRTVPRLAPFGLFEAKDGYVAICAPTDAFAKRLFEIMDDTSSGSLHRFATRGERVKSDIELHKLVEDWTARYTKHEIVSMLSDNDVPVAEVRDPKEAITDPHVVSRGETVPLTHPQFKLPYPVQGMGFPIRFSESAVGFSDKVSDLGEDSDEVYRDWLGYSPEKLKQLRRCHVV